MPYITKTLQGVIRITENGDYKFVLPVSGSVQNAISTGNNDEVYIIIEDNSLNAVNIFLPPISSFNGGWSTKIYVLDKNIGGGDIAIAVPINKIGVGDVAIPIGFGANTIQTIETLNPLNQDYITVKGTTSMPIRFQAFLHILDGHYWGYQMQ